MSAFILALVLASTPVRNYPAKFVGCYDADTCTVDLLLGMGVAMEVTVRLCDVDAPEVTGEEKEAGLKARDAINAFLRPTHDLVISVPQKVRCYLGEDVMCDKRDKYGRLLAYIVSDGMIVNRWLLVDGYAKPYGQGCMLP